MKEKTRSTDLMCAHVLAGGAFAKAAEISQKSHSYRFPSLCSISIEQRLVNPEAVGSNPAGSTSFPPNRLGFLALNGSSVEAFQIRIWLNFG
jgi:hypothetical protein